MTTMTLEAHLSLPVKIDLCTDCQAFWFDKYESLKLSPASTLKLMKFIGEHTAAGKPLRVEELRCPRCNGPLRLTNDMQRATRFSYFRCLKEHGRFIRFFEFLREKNFIRPLSPAEIQKLRQTIQTVNCSNCGAPVDLSMQSACSHCGAFISMLDMKQPQKMLDQLQKAEARPAEAHPADPAWSLELMLEKHDTEWWNDVSAAGLVQAGLGAVARLLNKINF